MKKILFILAFFLFIPSISLAGIGINPETGGLDLTIDIRTEDSSVIVYAPETLIVPNLSLTDNADGTCSLDFTNFSFGNISADNLCIRVNLSVGNHIFVGGNAYITGDTTMTGDLTIGGDATADGTVTGASLVASGGTSRVTGEFDQVIDFDTNNYVSISIIGSTDDSDIRFKVGAAGYPVIDSATDDFIGFGDPIRVCGNSVFSGRITLYGNFDADGICVRDSLSVGDYYYGDGYYLRMSKAIYAELSDSTDQAFAVPGTAYSITFNTNDEIVGVTHSTSTNPENITIVTTGVYTIFAQPQVTAAAGGAGTFHLWLQKDPGGGFADIVNTNIELLLASLDQDVIPLAATFALNAGDIIRLRASVSDAKIKLDAQTPGGEPAIPSIIFTMFMIGA